VVATEIKGISGLGGSADRFGHAEGRQLSGD
jgi:hypothetical protein